MKEITTTEREIGMLRQWLNEDRIYDPKKMITNEDIIYWLEQPRVEEVAKEIIETYKQTFTDLADK